MSDPQSDARRSDPAPYVADSWEREGDDPSYFYAFSPRGYAFGINAILYAMTH